MNPRAREIWARTSLKVWPERYWLVSLPLDAVTEATRLVERSRGAFAALVQERDEVSLTIGDALWRESPLSERARSDGPFRAITLDIDLDVCGFLAPAAARLAEAGISIVPQCGFLKDHLLVHESKLPEAIREIEALIASVA